MGPGVMSVHRQIIIYMLGNIFRTHSATEVAYMYIFTRFYGKVVSFVGDPVTLYLDRNDKNEWIWVGTAIKGVDFREQNLEKIDNLKATSIDFYATLRSLYLERRTRMITNQNPSEQDPFLEFDIE